ncbi:acetyl-CoA acetyltransferase [candidate division LCP-89 bacterium B3_LCP]|uniref:propanoyl-CoA C-acyltransferase n=1 Tax=candidate division LCP-89 bacterium B3_LCP TaxID=2012998 RepID=A0A532V2Y5_UNCL8|nr:MAG: acetyl-CoA acetyltransferase [candidate division LCP-89 bacterium B3_LCP]
MRDVFVVSGGVSKFAKARPDRTFQPMVKEAYDYVLQDIGLEFKQAAELIEGSTASYFSDHFGRQLMGGAMTTDYLGLCPKHNKRIEGGGATGGLNFQAGWESVASGRFDIVLTYGWETMSHVNTWKGNEFIALASDVSFDYPVGGFYSGYYAMMVTRHMKEYGTTVEQLGLVSVKNHNNAFYNPYAQKRMKINIEDVRNSEMVAWPLTMLDICTMSDGAAAVLFASEEGMKKLEKATGNTIKPTKVVGVGGGMDAMRMADRPHGKVPLLPHENAEDYKNLKYPGVHSFRSGRNASIEAYKMAGIADPINELDFIELHDAYTSSEIQTYEDMGLCKYGEGGGFVESGAPFMPGLDYGYKLPEQGKIPVNPSGGLIACGHPVGATGLMQAVFGHWQCQGTIDKHFGDKTLQIKDCNRGAIHSHAGTGTYVTVSILEKGF